MANQKDKRDVAHTTKKNEMVNIFKTCYHYYRNWIREILTTGKVDKFRFVKDEIGYTGEIAVNKPEVEKAKKVLKEYKAKNPNTVDMWW